MTTKHNQNGFSAAHLTRADLTLNSMPSWSDVVNTGSTYNPLQPTWADRAAESRLAVWLRKYLLCVCAGILLAGLAI